MRLAKKANRETAQYLTNGAQHILDIINGHFVSVRDGRRDATIELAHGPTPSISKLINELDALAA